MNKVVVLPAVFILGGLCGYYLPIATSNASLSQSSADVADTIPVNSAVHASPPVSASKTESLDDLVKKMDVKTPKTQFEGYRTFQKLDQFSVDEIEHLLLSLDETQVLLRGQIAWFFSGKFPERAFFLMESSMGDNQMSLAQTLFSNLIANQPEQVFDWLQNNENDFVMLFPIAEQQLNQKIALYQTLAVYPDWKWAAYEAGVDLLEENDRSQDKWSTRALAQKTAQSDPREAIIYALAQHRGVVDAGLLNGALTEYAKINPLEAKTLLLENQEHMESYTIDSVMDQLIARGNFSDVYALTHSLNDKKLTEQVINNAADKLYPYGSDKVLELFAVISDEKLKISAARSVVAYMSINGYSIDKQLEFMDAGLKDTVGQDKAITYALALSRGYKNDSLALKNYMDKLKFNNKEFALEVEKFMGYMQDI